MSLKTYSKLPAWEQLVIIQGAQHQPASPGKLRWSGKLPPPPVGTPIEIIVNGVFPAVVTGYFEEGTYLGLCVKHTKTVEVFGRKILKDTPTFVFGPEFRQVFKPIRLQPVDLTRIRLGALRLTNRKRVKIEVNERVNTTTGARGYNVLKISSDPEWNDTDLFDKHDWAELRKPIELNDAGNAIIDLSIYATDRDDQDLLDHLQVELDQDGLLAIHNDGKKHVWQRAII